VVAYVRHRPTHILA